MNPLQRNIAANMVGRGWIALMSLAFVPVYINFMGIAAYGLVGFFTTLQAVFAVLDLGLSATLNRELARFSAQDSRLQTARDLVRTLEVLYWGIAFCIGILVVVLAPVIASDWVQTDQLAPGTVQQPILIMGIILTIQWPLNFYSGGLMGLQRQVLLNVINIIAATVRSVGSAMVLWLVSPTILAFFGWQIFASAFQTLLVAFFLWRSLRSDDRAPRFQIQILRTTWRFAAGMSAISLITLFLTQADKIILSKLLTLEVFGYYMLASGVAGSLTNLVYPFFTALFPRFSALVAVGDQKTLTQLYHQGAQALSVIILPLTALIAFFAPELLMLWTGNAITVQHTYILVSILIIDYALNGLMSIPYALQLAHGWTKLAFYQNLSSAIIVVPALIWATQQYAALGAGFVWLFLNAGYVLILIQVMHMRLIPQEKWQWYFEDVGIPLFTAFSVAFIVRLLLPDQLSTPMTAIYILAALILTIAASAIATPHTRHYITKYLGKKLLQSIHPRVSQ